MTTQSRRFPPRIFKRLRAFPSQRMRGADTRRVVAVLYAMLCTAQGADSAAAQLSSAAHTAPTARAASHSGGYERFVQEASSRFGLPSSWIQAVIRVESAGDAQAVSSKGAMGLMQLMPETWTQLRVRYHLGADPFDPHDNIVAGTAYLRELFDRFGTAGFLAAYNAGPTRFEDYLAGVRPLNDDTRSYLAKLTQMLPDLGIGSGGTKRKPAANWRAAGLFANRSPVSQQPDDVSVDHASAGETNALSFALAPQSNGLFVPVDATAQR